MVTLRNLIFALSASAFTAALPTAEESTAPFSFESWAIALANGEQTLSVDEAIAAAANSTADTDNLDERSLEKRLRCDLHKPAYVPDAVACIDYLATSGLMCRVDTVVKMCNIGNAEVFASKVNTKDQYTQSTCEHVARALGFVMDNCWRPDNTVSGDHYAHGNGNMMVALRGPQ